MTRSAAYDPLMKYNYTVIISEEPNAQSAIGAENILFYAGFSEISSPKVTVNQKEYYEGGAFMNPHNIITNATFTPITLRRGVVYLKDTLLKKAQEVGNKSQKVNFQDLMGTVFNAFNYNIDSAVKKNYRYRIYINHVRRDSSIAYTLMLRNCVPTFFEPASDFNAIAEDSVSIESITFSYEGFEYIDLNTIGAAAYANASGAIGI